MARAFSSARPFINACVVLFLGLACTFADAAEPPWLEIHSTHFTVITDAGDKKGREVEHQVIEYCKQHQDQKIIHAIGLVIKEDRAERLMMEK